MTFFLAPHFLGYLSVVKMYTFDSFRHSFWHEWDLAIIHWTAVQLSLKILAVIALLS